MNPVTTALTLNLQLPNIATVSWAVQGDQLSRYIAATLVDGSTDWNPQAGYYGVVRCHKPDGTNCVYDVDENGDPAVTLSGNVATITIIHQALAVPGSCLMQLEFYDANDARVSAFGWVNNVQPSAVTDNEFLSSDYYNILTLQIAAVIGAETHPPYIDSTTKDWMIWDTDINDYVDSGVYSIGPPPTPQSTAYEYANDASGTTPPSSWSSTRPAPVQGQYSWTKVTITWETGTTVYYTVAYQGIDGTSAADVKAMIADEEATTTSAHAYAIGDRFILNNVLYIATAAIGIGDTITPGTNCQVDVLGDDVTALKTSLNSIDSYFTPKKIMFITDSYGNQVTDNNKRIDQLVGETLNIPTSHISVSGGSLHAGEIKTAVDAYSGDSDYDTIILVMGANDQTESDIAVQISSGMQNLVTSIKTKFDAYQIICLCCGLTFSSTYTTKSRINLALNYKKACENAKIRFVDNAQYLLCSTGRLQNDLCHPNTAGISAIADACVQAIYNRTVDVLLNANISDTSGRNYQFIRHNGVVLVNIKEAGAVMCSKSSITKGDASATETFAELNNSLVECSGNSAGDNNNLFGWCTVGSAEQRLVGSITITGKKIVGYVKTASGTANATNARLIGNLMFMD